MNNVSNIRLSGFADEIDKSLDIQIALLKELALSNLELRSVDGKNISAFGLDEAKVLYEKLRENQIGVSAIGSPIGKISIEDDFSGHFELFTHVVEIAKICHTPYIRVFSFYLDSEKKQLYRDEVVRRLRQMIQYASSHDVILLHENEKDIYGDTITSCVDLFEELYGPHFKATFDFANFVQCKEDPFEAYQKLKTYIAYIHIKDAVFSNADIVLPGQGDGRIAEILALLYQDGYTGYLSLEPHLADFEGYHQLEKNAMKKEYRNPIEAFRSAYQALNLILKDCSL